MTPSLQVLRYSEFDCSIKNIRSAITTAAVGGRYSEGAISAVALLTETIADSFAAATAATTKVVSGGGGGGGE